MNETNYARYQGADIKLGSDLGYFQGIPSELSDSASSCMDALQKALCLLEFPKCQGQTQNTLPVCWSVREHVANVCFKPFAGTSSSITQEQVKDGLFSPRFNSRWATSDSVQEPDCVSLQDHGLGAAPIENIRVVNDIDQDNIQAKDPAVIKGSLEERANEVDYDEAEEGDIQSNLVHLTLNARHLSRRERVKHHHHHSNHQHHKQPQRQHNHHHEKRVDTPKENVNVNIAGKDDAPVVAIRADPSIGQSVYTIDKERGSDVKGGDGVLLHKSINKAETDKGQKVLVQGGSGPADPAVAADSLAKASAGKPNANATKEADEAVHPHNGTVLLAAVPILLLMGAIAGFTIYRRYYENSFNEGGRNDTQDEYPGEGYYQRDVPIRKGSPIHFDRTFLNTPHSPPPAATYLHDPENTSRNQSPSSIASVSMKRPPPSAGSYGKTRFQELSRSYDFGAGFRSIKNVLTRSNNNSREGALDKASGATGSSGSLGNQGVDYAFGSGGHSIAKIGSHPGLSVLERQQLQQQYGANSGSSTSRFPDMKSISVSQEQSIVWGQYSADDDGVYQDATSAVVSNLARKSISSNSLSQMSAGKYSHHHHQSSGHQPDTPTDSIGDCLSPESPNMTRAGMMRHRALYSEGYTFDSEKSGHSTDLLFDARDNFLNFGVETVHETALRDEEMDMYLSMEKEESPFPLNDFNTMNPTPYEPKVLTRHVATAGMIQKTAVLSEKEHYPSQPSSDRPDEEFDEKKAMEAENKVIATSAPVHLEVPEETHVLGCESPESNPEGAGCENINEAPTTTSFSRVQAQVNQLSDNTVINTAEIIADEPLDLRKWEEGSSVGGSASSLPQLVGTQQTQPQSKKKGNKSKSKKGRR
ncbi:hypothetical protein BGZ76_008858 [Entomortierella beljakovae]|nr:hypothetical protein BGZ76_008858 [Entomortierella beljakovae]